MTPAEKLARTFHETYERLAPDFGYATREASAVPWDHVPEQNKALMVATATEVLALMAGIQADNPERCSACGLAVPTGWTRP